MKAAIKNKQIVGVFQENANGWKFIPMSAAHTPSRKRWPSPEKALPSWAKGAYVIEGNDMKEVWNKAQQEA